MFTGYSCTLIRGVVVTDPFMSVCAPLWGKWGRPCRSYQSAVVLDHSHTSLASGAGRPPFRWDTPATPSVRP